MDINEKCSNILKILDSRYLNAGTELKYSNLYELVVAVILSAQCTDKRVNQVTPRFFQLYPNFYALANAKPEEVAITIHSISYPHSKAKHLVNLAKRIVKDFNGKVPNKFDQLIKLPGIGRKSANVILAVGFQKPTIPVDTHVFRVAHRLGLSNAKTPEKTEIDLMKQIPENWYIKAHHLFILHGRYICKARKPQCEQCPLTNYCDYYKQKKSA